MRKVSRTVPAPSELGTAVMGVPAGEELELKLRLEAVMEGVLVSGAVSGRAVGECIRCLDEVELQFEAPIQELFAYPDRVVEEAGDDDVRELQADLIDLEPALRDAVVLALPFQPVCSEDCPGLCVDCGIRLADEPGHHHEVADPRWAALESILTEGMPAGPAEAAEPVDEKEN